jgi:hypothetical protein
VQNSGYVLSLANVLPATSVQLVDDVLMRSSEFDVKHNSSARTAL